MGGPGGVLGLLGFFPTGPNAVLARMYLENKQEIEKEV